MAVSDGDRMWVDKGMGLVPSVFNDYSLAALTGYLGIGHTRYSTTGSSKWHNAQPIFCAVEDHVFALAHNGNLVNTLQLVAEADLDAGHADSDSDVIAQLVAAEMNLHIHLGHDHLEGALLHVLPRLRGAFSLVIMDKDRLIGVRDPNGFRPLFLGRLSDGGWVLASETPALDVVSAQTVREIEPGEMVVIDATGVRSLHPFAAEVINPTLCLLEFVYIARPDGVLRRQGINGARVRMGKQLAIQSPAEADLVIPIPASGIPGAQGFAQQSGIPYGDGLIKNGYIGRTFIAPTQELREAAVKIKLNPIRDNVDGKRLVVVEDSIIRATTLRQTMVMLREAGAKEIHLRICSPPYKWPCFYGLDTGERSKLIAANHDIDWIREHLGADSLAYLDLDHMIGAISPQPEGFCTACFTGDYPVPVDGDPSEDALTKSLATHRPLQHPVTR